MRMRFEAVALAIGAAMSVAMAARAQAPTPPDCHWVPLAQTPTTVELWCRGADGNARPTGQTHDQSQDTSGGCRRGKVYDGARCVSPSAALRKAAAADPATSTVAPSPTIAGAKPRSRVLLTRGADGKAHAGIVCTQDRDATVCQDLPGR